MTVIVKHAKTNAISDWTQAQLDEQISLGNFPAGTTLANIVLPSDWNNDHTLTGVGTMAEQNANSVAITGGAIDGTTIGATTASTGVFTTLTSTGQTFLGGVSGSDVVRVYKDNTIAGTTASFTAPALSFIPPQSGFGAGILRSSTQLNITTGSATPIVLQTASTLGFSGTEQARVSHTASAVNYVQVTGSATTARPVISTQGSDSNIGLDINAKGTSDVTFRSGTSATFQAIMNSGGDSWLAANRMTGLANLTATSASASNVAISLQTKGTGAIDLAAGSSGVNISNGGTVTALTRSGQGFTYTSIPSLAISAPTTAGGVQATATPHMFINTAPVTSGGTGYTVGNVLTVVGGTPTGSAATLTVAAVSGGVITSVTSTNFAQYSALPTSPISVTGGSGSGATFTPLWGNGTTFTITNAGSGYIEQPTVTFSGGGGSGAAAFAIVGGVTTIKGIGSSSPGNVANSILFSTPGGIGFSVQDRAATSVNYAAAIGNVTTQPGIIRSVGSDTNVGLNLGTQGTGVITFATNTTTSNIQMQVAHTASAVNFVQVTGSTTGNFTAISAQGSDTNVSLSYISKGTGQHIFATNSSSGNGQFRVLHTAGTIANYGTVTGNVAGSAPVFSVAGTDTNIDLALTPKGTGLVRFGTLTATADTAISGYITIKDSGGTTRKLAVIT